MPLKWRIYYWCSLYYLIWNIITIFIAFYRFFSEQADISDYLILLLPGIMLLKPLYCIKFINHYKQKTFYEDDEVFLFVIFFVLNIIYGTIAAVAFNYLFSPFERGLHFDATNTLLIIAISAFIVSSIYLMIFDMPLKSAVRKQYTIDVNKIGEELNI